MDNLTELVNGMDASDLRSILVGEVPKQEDIAFVVIGVARPALMEGHAIEVGISGMAHHLNVIERDMDVLGGLEHAAKIVKILLLRLLVVADLLGDESLWLLLGDDTTGDD